MNGVYQVIEKSRNPALKEYTVFHGTYAAFKHFKFCCSTKFDGIVQTNFAKHQIDWNDFWHVPVKL